MRSESETNTSLEASASNDVCLGLSEAPCASVQDFYISPIPCQLLHRANSHVVPFSIP